MERPLELVWVNAPKKTRARRRKEEDWAVLKPDIIHILTNFTWENAVVEVEKLGLTDVTYVMCHCFILYINEQANHHKVFRNFEPRRKNGVLSNGNVTEHQCLTT